MCLMFPSTSHINEIGYSLIEKLHFLFLLIYDNIVEWLQLLRKYTKHRYIIYIRLFNKESYVSDNLNYNNPGTDILLDSNINVSGPSLSMMVLNNLLTDADYYNSKSAITLFEQYE